MNNIYQKLFKIHTLNKLEPIYAMKLLDVIGGYSSVRDMNSKVEFINVLLKFIDEITEDFNKKLDELFWY